MDFDISHLLDQWDYQPGQVVVRRFKAKDGRAKIQLRVDLGLLQMCVQGRPDGKRPFGHPSLLEYYRARLHKYVGAHAGNDEGFKLKPEDCARLQLEALQYYHRYICLLQLEDYAGVIRDAERNMAVFDFVSRHAANEDLAWSLQQFRPQLLMVLTRARAAQALQVNDHVLAIQQIEEGLEAIRAFCHEHARGDAADRAARCSRWRIGWRKSAPNARCRAGKSWSGPCTKPSIAKTTSAQPRCAISCATSSRPSSRTPNPPYF